MSSAHYVVVSQLNPTTTDKALEDFFSFCGKIISVEHQGDTAKIYYEKPSSVKTALMLNGGTLEGSTIAVKSEGAAAEETHTTEHSHDGPFDQSDKPRAGIAAEYLARGYTLSDDILQRAIALDNQHGISHRFLSYFNSIDSSIGSRAVGENATVSGKLQETFKQATTTIQNVDQQRGISTTATDYFTKALSSSWGQKVKAFYTTTSKQVVDIHEEAKRIKDSKKGHTPTNSTTHAASPADIPVSTTSAASAKIDEPAPTVL